MYKISTLIDQLSLIAEKKAVSKCLKDDINELIELANQEILKASTIYLKEIRATNK